MSIDDENSTYRLLPNGSVESLLYPWDEGQGTWSSCLRYDSNYTSQYFLSGSPATSTVACSSWIYDKSIYKNTISMEVKTDK